MCVSISQKKQKPKKHLKFPPPPGYSYSVSDDKLAQQANNNKGKNQQTTYLQTSSSHDCTFAPRSPAHPTRNWRTSSTPCSPQKACLTHVPEGESALSSFLSKNNSQIICSKTRLFWFLPFKMQSPSIALDKPTLFGKRTSRLLNSTVKWFILKSMELSRINCIYCIH